MTHTANRWLNNKH